MFDDITYEDILARCLSAVPSDVDKREGSMIYDALAAGCLEIYNLYNDMNYAFEQSFPDTAESEYLDMLAADRGITRRGATAAVINVSFTGVDVPLGTRFSIDGNTYFVSSVNSDKTVYQLTCEQLGSEGNHASGSVLPIDDISGLKSASIIEISAAGEDEETDQSLRDRYSASVAAYTYGGNVSNQGNTRVQSGRLLVDNTEGSGTGYSKVVVSAGATLGGVGTIGGFTQAKTYNGRGGNAAITDPCVVVNGAAGVFFSGRVVMSLMVNVAALQLSSNFRASAFVLSRCASSAFISTVLPSVSGTRNTAVTR